MLTCYRTFDNWKQGKVSIIHVLCSHSASSSHPAIEAEREWGFSGLFLWHFPGHCLAPSLCGGGGCSPAPSLYAQHTSSQVVNGGFNPVGRDSLRSIRNSLAKCTRCQRPDHQVSRGGGYGSECEGEVEAQNMRGPLLIREAIPQLLHLLCLNSALGSVLPL